MEADIVTDLKVHSRHNCYRLSPDQMNAIQSKGVSVTLKPGTNVVKLLENETSYTTGIGDKAEPWVLLWIYGGKVVNSKTNVEVVATWASLNGYEDSLTMTVIESATLCAFLFDTSTGNHSGELTLSVTTL
ncbi:MAG: hypothetical protein KTR27_15090 [Leptolyngbyaceae cyanobacterium MAG.088]|nr:hypothetical protein [Leptolyngbyaceae cyanobacterium MAG.088]